MRARALILGLILPAVVLLTSCSKREDVTVAQYADQKITVGDFEKAYAIVNPEFLPKETGLEGYREFVITMINKGVMAYKADELGYDKDPSVVQGMEAFKSMGLQAGYLKRTIADNITISEDEAKEHYRNRGATMQIKQILVDTPDQAEEVMQLLEDGVDFESVCKKLSVSPDAAEGGQVMTVAYGRYSPELQKAIFANKAGEYTEPILTPYGFFIVKNLRRIDGRGQEKYEDIHDTIVQEARVLKEMLETNAHTERLRDEYGVEWYWDNMAACFEAMPSDRQFDQAPSRSNEVYPLLYFDADDLEKPVAAYSGKDILIKDFSDYYDQASFFARPRKDFRIGGVRRFIMQRIMADLVQREMVRSDIANDPEIKAAMRGKFEELMISRLWDDMVNSQTVVTAVMSREYYNENIDDFKMPEKRRFGVIVTGDVEEAQKAYGEIQSGTLFRTVVMAYSIDETTKRTLGETDLLTNGEQPEIDAVGFALPGVGSVSEPFQTSRGWMIVKVTELEDSGEFTFEQARLPIRGALKEKINDERLNELLEKWKEELNVTIFDDNLAKIQVEERTADPKKK